MNENIGENTTGLGRAFQAKRDETNKEYLDSAISLFYLEIKNSTFLNDDKISGIENIVAQYFTPEAYGVLEGFNDFKLRHAFTSKSTEQDVENALEDINVDIQTFEKYMRKMPKVLVDRLKSSPTGNTSAPNSVSPI